MNILLVEDDPLNQKIVSYILTKQGASVEMAMDGNLAIEILSKRKFNLVLMDIQMPVMDGYKTAQYIRQKMNITIPIIALTADPFADRSDEYSEAGINACVCKPIDPISLYNLISSLVKK